MNPGDWVLVQRDSRPVVGIVIRGITKKCWERNYSVLTTIGEVSEDEVIEVRVPPEQRGEGEKP